MRRTLAIGALALFLATLTAGQAALADNLDLVCRVKESRADGAERMIRRRLNIDLSHKTVRVSDDVGHGWVFKREYAIASVNPVRVQLESGGGKQSYVDRRKGEYFFHNQADGVTMHGVCEKLVGGAPRY